MLQPNQEILFTRQRHEAKRAGLHYDIRLVVGDKAYSWATKKDMPEPGKSILLYEQPIHDAVYALTKHIVIPDGQYGAGVTTLDTIRKARVGENSTPDQFTLYTTNGEKFLMKRLDQEKYGKAAWLFRNLTTANKYLDKIESSRGNQILPSV